MTYLLSEFKPWAIRKGYNVSVDDLKHIELRIGHLNRTHQRGVLKHYIAEWNAGMDECEELVKKENRGRFRANTWLRETFASMQF